jgi:hypothetical protein
MDKGFTGTNGNGPVDAASFAQDSITFTLKFTGKLSESDISDVRFQWGTALDEGNEPGLRPNAVPEPSSLWGDIETEPVACWGDRSPRPRGLNPSGMTPVSGLWRLLQGMTGAGLEPSTG